ncbi:phage tail tape measure protein, TP901 family, core region [Acinetobacter calcoaceticus ANC 3811]|uniref:Phage tail tape measure protein, TP901 family, core region n=1 Tax=Acinetobacter calcoaceticus ANC 3811 TaxID=1217690 RepID=R8Y444_ACICA|nr:phage tail tape measure protein, TP901 family, core region [Acinetobacter calcoaceticus]EOQ63901.1 phage tail tape measure protein, TP901 family, core region [Acinetobacter calcoaceticus ANC 3811]
MAKNGVIRDFLVSLGFDTDNSGLASMKSAMDGIEWKAKALNGALMALATGAVVAVRQTASELDKLYFSSQRIGASVTNINAYGNAITQLGGSAEGAVGSLESLAEKIRNSPGYEGQIKSLGVSTRDANGQMRDRIEVMKDLSGVLAKMPAYQANAYANSLGIDQKTMLAMRDGKFISNMEKYQKIQKELGMNDDLAKSGNEFMTEYRDLTMMTKTGFQVFVMQAGKALIPILRLLNQLIQAGIHAFSQLNPHIKEGLAIGLRFAMLALMFSAMAKSLGLLLKFIPALKTFIGLLKLFRLAFLASPIGIILALGAALALLYDDYKTWKDGGKSLFDWSKWTDGIDTIINKIKDFLDILNRVKNKTIEFVQKIINDPAGALKDVATDVKESVDKTKKAVEEYVNPPEPEKVTPTQEKVATATQYVKSVVEKGVAAATGVAKATVEAVKRVVNPGNSKYAFSFGSKIDGYIKEASKKYGIPEDVLRGFVKMEAGWTGKMSPTGAIGTGQFIQSTWDGLAKTDAGKEIGMTQIGDRFRTKDDPRYDKRINTLATGLLAKQNAKILKKYGLAVTGENLYLAHNIGAETFARALSGKGASKKGLLAMRQNGMKENETPQQFVLRQAGIFKKHYKAANKLVESPINDNSTALNVDASFGTYGPPNGNPHKSQVNNSNSLSASNVVIHQSFQTDVTVNGASSPMDSANAIKRQQEYSLVFMARSAKGAFVG